VALDLERLRLPRLLDGAHRVRDLDEVLAGGRIPDGSVDCLVVLFSEQNRGDLTATITMAARVMRPGALFVSSVVGTPVESGSDRCLPIHPYDELLSRSFDVVAAPGFDPVTRTVVWIFLARRRSDSMNAGLH
jgi:hypothetical protein